MNCMKVRVKRELEMVENDPPAGITFWSVEGMLGHDNSPYEKGVFHLDINITERYPFEPPAVKFTTPVYHPNIDTGGRICLDLLKKSPRGSWKPSVNISTLLLSIRILMINPNPENPLMSDIAKEFRTNKQKYLENARAWTLKYAVDDNIKLNHKRKNETDIEGDDTTQQTKSRNIVGRQEGL